VFTVTGARLQFYQNTRCSRRNQGRRETGANVNLRISPAACRGAGEPFDDPPSARLTVAPDHDPPGAWAQSRQSAGGQKGRHSSPSMSAVQVHRRGNYPRTGRRAQPSRPFPPSQRIGRLQLGHVSISESIDSYPAQLGGKATAAPGGSREDWSAMFGKSIIAA
jgi:hypothetical protein